MPHQINKMTSFTNDPAATNCWVLGPVVCRNGTGIYSENKSLGLLYRGQKFFHFFDLRGKPTVKTNHQFRCRSSVRLFMVFRLDIREFISMNSQWFFDKNIFPCS